jgi:hypothetical protein
MEEAREGGIDCRVPAFELSKCKGDRVGYDRIGFETLKGTVRDEEELKTRLGIRQVESYRINRT